jgi:diaminopimelate epimerase
VRAVNLTKHHGLGNDFLVLLDLDERFDGDLGELARAACDRRRGIGADGLIRATPGTDGTVATMELRNADGGRAEMSGNGIRCLVQALADAEAGLGPELVVGTDAGPRRCTLHGEDSPGRRLVAVEMGRVEIVTFDMDRAEVDVGNPHLVVRVADTTGADLAALGTAHPDRNVEIVRPGPQEGEVTMRVHERGVGETLACGTGAVAVAAVARRWELAGDEVTVHMPGGAATVTLHEDEATLTGPAERIARVEFAWR